MLANTAAVGHLISTYEVEPNNSFSSALLLPFFTFSPQETVSTGILRLCDRTVVTEGFSRIVAVSPRAELLPMLQGLTTPILSRIQCALTVPRSGGDMENAHKVLKDELTLFACVLRYLDGPGRDSTLINPSPGAPPVHPVMEVLQQAWPLLAAACDPEQCPWLGPPDDGQAAAEASAAVVPSWLPTALSLYAACLSVFERSMTALSSNAAALLPSMVTAAVRAFQRVHLPAALQCIAAAVEAFGSSSAEAVASFSQVLSLVCNHVFKIVSTGDTAQLVSEKPELVIEFYEVSPILVVANVILIACFARRCIVTYCFAHTLCSPVLRYCHCFSWLRWSLPVPIEILLAQL
jgi:hypothetical protein